MEVEERKRKFVKFLNELLEQNNGVKKQLAKRLNINPSTLTSWLQGKIDPASLELTVFIRVAETCECSTDELATRLEIKPNSPQTALNKFQKLIQELLFNQSQEQLGKKIGVTHGAIAGWLSSQRPVAPRRINISTIAGLAQEKGWKIEQLLAYLGLKEIKDIKEDLFSQIQNSILKLPFQERVKLLGWLFNDFEQQLSSSYLEGFKIANQKKLSNKTILLVFEENCLSILPRRISNLESYTLLRPENIEIATTSHLPESLEDFDILLFDISSSESEAIRLIQDISFDGDIVVFTSEDLPENLRAGLEDKVTDLVIKPIDWSSLKDKEYFR